VTYLPPIDPPHFGGDADGWAPMRLRADLREALRERDAARADAELLRTTGLVYLEDLDRLEAAFYVLTERLKDSREQMREALALLREIKASDDNYLDLLERRDALLKRYAKEIQA
jgi:hypothetical protein